MTSSPGVYINEFDQSDYVSNVVTTRVGLVGGASKGPVNEPTTITNEAELVNAFGAPLVDDYALQAAILYLRRGQGLIFQRVADATVETAKVTVQDALAADVFDIEAASPGSWGNNLDVVLSASAVAGYYNVTVRAPADKAGTLQDVEQYLEVSLSSSDSRYIETVINDGIIGEDAPSEYISITIINGTLTPVLGTYDVGSTTTGADGITGLADSDYIGGVVGNTVTGLQAFANDESVDIDLLAVPGVYSPDVLNAAVVVAEGRGDAFVLGDCPFGLSYDDVIDWHNGAAPYVHSAFNTSYLGLFWAWAKVYDSYNSRDLWLPPSAIALERYAYNDSVAQPWWPCAGPKRGVSPYAKELEFSPGPSQRDQLYGAGSGRVNAINPFVNFTGRGITIYGQRTTQRRASAFDRVHVRRMFNYVKKQAKKAIAEEVFEFSDVFLWNEIKDRLTTILDNVKAQRGLSDYRVICDETTNTATVRYNNQAKGRVLIKHNPAAEAIILDFVALPTGVDFTESA